MSDHTEVHEEVKRRIAPVQVRKQRVLDAAIATFLENGYDGTSVDEIAKLSKICKPTIYRWFTNKEGLFKAASVEAAAFATKAVGWIGDDTRPPEIVLREAARELMKARLNHKNRELMRLTLSIGRRFPHISTEIRSITLQNVGTPIAKYFARFSAGGDARFQGKEMFLANMFILLAQHGLLHLFIEPKNTEEDYAHIDAVVDLFLTGAFGNRMAAEKGDTEPGGRQTSRAPRRRRSAADRATGTGKS